MRFLAIFLFSVTTLIGQSDPLAISFVDNDLQEALKIAESKDKIIFIDAYTTWCGPCKMMDKEIFSDSAVGAFYNEHYVNLKLDMEKGEGVDFASKYQVQAYPSFLFIDSDGRLLHRGVGYQPMDRFIDLGQQAQDPKRQLGMLEAAFDKGDRSEELLYNYAMALASAMSKKSEEIGGLYLDTQDNWATKKNMDLIVKLIRSYDDPYYNFLLEKKHLFYKEYGQGRVNGMVLQLLERHLYSNIDEVDMAETKALYIKSFPASKAIPYFDLFEVNYYDRIGKKEKYVSKTRDYVKKYRDLSWNTLNQIAWNFYEKIDDEKATKWAIKWAKKSIAKESNYFNNDTIAALYFKQGNTKKAEKYAIKAIALAKEAGAVHEETTELLKKIRAT